MRKTFLISLASFLFLTDATAQKGLLHVNVSGLPSGSVPIISVSGPGGFSKTISHSETLTNLASGTYEFVTKIDIHREASISKAYRLGNFGSAVVVKNDTQQVHLTYRLMPGSDKLWIGNQNAVTNTSTRIVGYGDDVINTTQSSDATTKLTNRVTSAKGIAFDKFGNLWLADAYTLKMFEWNALDKTDVAPKVTHTLKEPSPCVTFDADGNLWVSNGRKVGMIFRIPSAKLYTSGKPIADIELSGNAISGVQNIAFDSRGNLWINHADKNSVVKINAASIQRSSTTLEPDVIFECQSNPPVKMTLSAPKALAFDKKGNLWIGFFGPNVIAMIPASQLNTSKSIQPNVQITLSVGVLLNSIAFDESGALWTALSSGKFGKLSAGQLTSGGKKTPDVIVTSQELKYASGLAFYPIPEGLPLK